VGQQQPGGADRAVSAGGVLGALVGLPGLLRVAALLGQPSVRRYSGCPSVSRYSRWTASSSSGPAVSVSAAASDATSLERSPSSGRRSRFSMLSSIRCADSSRRWLSPR
jgi:hypothetical protein